MEYIEWAFLALVIGSFIILFFKDGQPAKEHEEATTPGGRLRDAMRTSPQLEFFVGIPANQPQTWTRVDGLDGNVVWTKDSGAVELTEIRSYLAAYRSGEMVQGESVFEPLPAGIHSPQPVRGKPKVEEFDTAKLRDGESYLRITFAASVTQPTNPAAYSIRLQNISSERIRISKFGKHRLIDGRPEIGPWRTGIDFREQFGMTQVHWIEPGATVICPHEIGQQVYWIFDGETEYSRSFTAGKPLA